jgi:hypothetical protein
MFVGIGQSEDHLWPIAIEVTQRTIAGRAVDLAVRRVALALLRTELVRFGHRLAAIALVLHCWFTHATMTIERWRILSTNLGGKLYPETGKTLSR